MALVVKDRVMETATTTGTGAFTLAGAVAGFRAFSTVCSTNDTAYYLIEAVDTNGVPTGDWETGLGTYSGANTLTRTTVSASSNSNAAVSFSAGTKRVSISAVASELLTFNAWERSWGPLLAEAPATVYATLDARNGHPVLTFDPSTAWSTVFTGDMPSDYSGAGITLALYWAVSTGTTGNVCWQAALERINVSSQSLDSDGFATAQSFTAAAVPGTNGQIIKSSLSIANGANMDSIAAGELFRLKITRDATNANDTATGNAQLLFVTMVSQ